MRRDARGLALTTQSDTAAAAFDEALLNYLRYRTNTGQCIKRAIEADPDFALGHCFRGYLFLLFSSTAFLPKARTALTRAESLAKDATGRERAHVAALGAWATGDMTRTCRIWSEILAEHPHDILALRLQHFAFFWTGQSAALRDVPAGLLEAWDESLPGYGTLLGMLAFGREECGDYVEAERAGRRAVEIDPDDLWALHAVAHVFEMQGRHAEGLDWLDYPADAWDDRNPFRNHLWWHRALFALDAGDLDGCLALYDRTIRPEPGGFYLDLQNAASLLARLSFLGIDLGSRWRELAELVETRMEDHVLAFTEPHAMMALSADGRAEAGARLLDSLRAFGRTAGNSAAALMPDLVIPLCEAILAFGEGAYGRCLERARPLRPAFAELGGSHAQRDVLELLLIEAAIRSDQAELARTLLAERTRLRPFSQSAWAKYSAVLESLGESAQAADARARAKQATQGPESP